jgi:hypothetical protein
MKDKHEGKRQAEEMKCSRHAKESKDLDTTEVEGTRRALNDKIGGYKGK